MGGPRADDAPDRAEGAAQRVHSGILDARKRLLFDGLSLFARGLEEDSRAAVERLELGRVDLGHLQDRDAHADDEESHDDGDDLADARFKPLEEDLDTKFH